MRQKLLLYFSILIVVVAAIMGTASYTISRGNYEGELRGQLLSQIDLFSAQWTGDPAALAAEFTDALPDVRITIVEPDGKVAYDSEGTELGNHRDRPEIARAFETGEGSVKRFSNSTWKTYLYAAKRVTHEGREIVVRFSVPMEYLKQIDRSLAMYLLLAMLGSVCVALCLSYAFTKKIVVPVTNLSNYARDISEGRFDRKFSYRGRNEIGQLTQSVKLMHHRLERTIHALEERNVQLGTILNSTPSGIVALDPEGIILLINRMAVQMLALAHTDTVGKEFYAVCRNQAIADFLSDPNTDSQELELDEQIYHLTKSGMIGDDGVSAGTVMVLQDITEMKRLANLRSEFASNVSHELKTPLTSIKGFIDTLKNGAMDDPKTAARFLDIIDVETDRLTSLINDTMEVSNLESGKWKDNPTLCNVDDLVEEVLEMVEKQAAEKEIVLSYRNESGQTEFRMNRARLRQVLLNLVTNAIRYNKEMGSVDITLDADADSLILQVKDTGIGIGAEDIPRIFERFYRVDKGRSRESGGTGLGLSIVKHIAQMYGGSVRVESEPGIGSEFTVTIPFGKQGDEICQETDMKKI